LFIEWPGQSDVADETLGYPYQIVLPLLHLQLGHEPHFRRFLVPAPEASAGQHFKDLPK
jgi:hypothetical protein